MSATPVLVLATANQHKLDEMRAILAPLLPGVEPEQIVSMAQFDVPSPAEDALTFAGNAEIKARAVADATGLPALADDSGLSVDALNGAPGIFSARWSGNHGDDRANLELLLAQLADVRDGDRGAQFVCAAALALPNGPVEVAEGVVRGTLIREAHGSGGFGYDPAFVPEGFDVTTAQLTAEEKNRISHRSRALAAIAPRLRVALGL